MSEPSRDNRVRAVVLGAGASAAYGDSPTPRGWAPRSSVAATGDLLFPGDLQRVAEECAFRAFLRTLYRQDWVVYAKPPFGSTRATRYADRINLYSKMTPSLCDRKFRVFLDGGDPK